MSKRIGGFLNELGVSWKESLKLLLDKRFWLVTFKSALETYTELIKRFWWIIGACFVSDVLVRTKMLSAFNESFTILWFLLWCLLAFIVFLIVRSSLEKKDSAYYISYWKSYIWFVCVTLVLWGLRLFIKQPDQHVNIFSGLFLTNLDYLIFLKNLPGLSTVYFSPFLVLYTFFYLDSPNKVNYFIKRLWSTCCMVFYTFPFCLLVWFFISLSAFLLEYCVIKFSLLGFGWLYFETHPTAYDLIQIIADDATKLLIPFFIALLHTLYTKQVHDHYERYEV